MAVDVWMELGDKDMLIAFMRARGLSCRTLAKECERAGYPVSHQWIGFLRSGRHQTCAPGLAFAIEKTLGVPPLVLFYPKAQRRSVAA